MRNAGVELNPAGACRAEREEARARAEIDDVAGASILAQLGGDVLDAARRVDACACGGTGAWRGGG